MKVKELKAILVRENKTLGDCAKYLGISENTMSAKLKRGVFGSDEITKLISYLHIDNPTYIFFGM